jgi:hypothetical protein
MPIFVVRIFLNKLFDNNDTFPDSEFVSFFSNTSNIYFLKQKSFLFGKLINKIKKNSLSVYMFYSFFSFSNCLVDAS